MRWTSIASPARVRWFVIGVALVGLVCPVFSETVASYRFEEGVGKEFARGVGTVPDSSGNKLHGTCQDDPGGAYSAAIAPFGDGAFTLTKRGDWVFVPDSPKLQLTKSLTLEAWVNIRRFQTNGVANFILFRGDDRSGTDAYWLALDPAGETLHFGVEGPGGRPSDPPALVSTRFGRYIGETVHVAGVLDDKTGFLGLYVNGRLKESMRTSIRPRKELHPIYQPGLGIGGYFAGPAPGSFCIDGTIDEARISDVALRPEQFLFSCPPPR
ncbi:MAG: LamG domain-containing protein [Armatimonadetes bacterium]|nr:LamG domain-containing protein [Armatimonadota bacterium]